MGMREDIRALYRENPQISSAQIIERLGIKPTRKFWQVLNHEQVTLRGLYPGKRKNTHAHNKATPRGMVRFIPPEKK
jgi:hypothetical protein